MGKNIGVILAGGKGERLNAGIPKQFIRIQGKMIIEYTIENLENAQNIDKIYLTINPNYLDIGKELSKKYEKISKIVDGGRTRTESIYNSGLELEEDVGKVIFIDAVRPFVLPHVFDDFIELLSKYDVVKFCSKIVDYLVYTGGENLVRKVMNRNDMRLCKAPVGYRAEVLKMVVSNISRDDVIKFETDLEMILEKVPNVKIFTYESSELNLKITYKDDLELASILFQYLPRNS
ncbi:Uncharacterized protein family UPF0007 [Aciduliprofundum boonei T469]|nr:Uncharacterized protein family UPF0007 [Aciduliprofundum boonei T469]